MVLIWIEQRIGTLESVTIEIFLRNL